jgi:hypothetical protein
MIPALGVLLAQAIPAQGGDPQAGARWGWGWVLGAAIVAVLAMLGVFVGRFGDDARSGRPG